MGLTKQGKQQTFDSMVVAWSFLWLAITWFHFGANHPKYSTYK
jgi:hypothetical protein